MSNIVIKLIGGLIVCLSSGLLGVYFASKSKFRVRDLTEIRKCLVMLIAEIDFAYNPLPVAFYNIAQRTGKPFNQFFLNASDRLAERNGAELRDIWNTALDVLNGTYLEFEDLDMLLQLGQTLGYLDQSMQKSSIQMAVSYIDEKTKKVNAEAEKNRRLYRSLGVLGGLLITIIFI